MTNPIFLLPCNKPGPISQIEILNQVIVRIHHQTNNQIKNKQTKNNNSVSSIRKKSIIIFLTKTNL